MIYCQDDGFMKIRVDFDPESLSLSLVDQNDLDAVRDALKKAGLVLPKLRSLA
jgi:hypothetical protein